MIETRTCLVLGGREALARLELPIDQALQALNMTRAHLPSIDDLDHAMRSVDVVFAVVSKVSTSISFELGVARTLGIPLVHVASEGSRVPAVFEPVIRYRDSESVPRLGFIFARAIEDALAGRPSEFSGGVPDDGGEPSVRYAPGDQFVAIVVHVARESGYFLVTELGRKPALLPVSLMIEGELVNVGERIVREGDALMVEVLDVDPDRVTVREADAHAPNRLGSALVRVRSILRACQLLESIAEPERRGIEHTLWGKQALEWVAIHTSSVKRLRQLRNQISHGELIGSADLAEAADAADEFLSLALNLTSPVNPAQVAALVEGVMEQEHLLLSILRHAGVPILAKLNGARSLAVVAERAGLIPTETRCIVEGLASLRNDLVHRRGNGLDGARVAYVQPTIDVASRSLKASLDQLDRERRMDQG